MKIRRIWCVAAVCVAMLACAPGVSDVRAAEGATAGLVLVEAEGFDGRGGWVIDQQFMDQMGSSMLLAHGMGVPVEDAETTVTFPAAGTYRVWVRTWDWASLWKGSGSPGKFRLVVNRRPLKTVFGTEGEKWHWQDGGTVEIRETKATVALRDLTGFDGRCDAILFSRAGDYRPPEDLAALTALRRKLLNLPDTPKDAGEFDLVVVGGGVAGTCTAISAARLGLNVALIQNRPVLGGNNSSEVRVHLSGKMQVPPYPQLGDVVDELDSGHHGNARPGNEYGDDRKLSVVRAEKNLHLFLSMHAYKAEMRGGRIVAVIAKNIQTGRDLRFPGALFADCTGDGNLGVLAGADFRVGRESRAETSEALAPEKADRQTMGASVMWYSQATKEDSPFPDCPWAIQFTEESCQHAVSGNWNWETGMNLDQIADAERVRDHGLRAVYGNWAFQKNRSTKSAKYARRELSWVAFVAGKRESRRLLGDVILKQQDVVSQRSFPDASVTTTWSIDLHYPLPENTKHFAGREFRTTAKHVRIKPYAIPYRCLYSRNVENLFMAGRNISVTHVALGTIRVMRTTGMMGEVLGMAASLCKKHNTMPRGVYEHHLDSLKDLMSRGIGKKPLPRTHTPKAGGGLDGKKKVTAADTKPLAWLTSAGTNLALVAKVTVSSNHASGKYKGAFINDGQAAPKDNNLRWVSGTELPHVVELAWDAPQTISAIRIVSGWNKGKQFVGVLEDFSLAYHDGSAWKPVPGGAVSGNGRVDWGVRFDPIQTRRIRLTVTGMADRLARIWEIEAYAPPAPTKERSYVEPSQKEVVLVEAEGFRDRGGWVLDQQFMDEMGSPFLLAHGLGVPVKDATTTVTFPAAGSYRVWVRTRDWVAPWKALGAPGKFQVLVGDKALGATFGTKGAAWQWQDGGTVEIADKQTTVALHDLTGFEGRCEAIAFCVDKDFRPPNDLEALTAWRRAMLGLPRSPPDGGTFDLVVVGGGIAGTSAALSAGRLGLTVALVQDRPVLGGNNSSEVRVWLNGETNFEPYPRIGDIVKELDQKRRSHYGPTNTADLYEDDRKTALVKVEKNITLLLGHRANGVEMRDGAIAAVIAQDTATGRRVRLTSRLVADCTGHGVIGELAGAEFQMTRKGHMGRCNLWNVVDTGKRAAFPRCPWALDLSDKPFPGRANAKGKSARGGLKSLGGWYWESGFDHDPFEKGEYIRDWNFRAMYGAWDAIKNVDKLHPNHKLNWAAYISGPRESRRLVGDVVLTKEHVLGGKTWPDACVPCTWKIDLHLPDARYVKGFEGDAFISRATFTAFKKPYWLPYRCLYSRNVPNLFMAGRDISVTHEALGTVRVMRTCGMMGEVVGMAASLCGRYRTTPRGVYEDHLDELKALMKQGVGKDAAALPTELRNPPDISTVEPDLTTPPMTDGAPAAGKRVKQTLPEYKGTGVHHALYLPTDWKAGRTWPVIVEYAGNGGYRNKHGDVSDGTVEGSNFGYGISGGKGFIWVCLPYVNVAKKTNETRWWGDVDATVAYCKQAVGTVCRDYGGDAKRVVLTGFSRGAIGCNYLGLHDDEIAALWRAFIPYSHYDGVRKWGYASSDRASALVRLKRLKGRPQLICHEGSVRGTMKYLDSTGVQGDFTFLAAPFRNHNDRWAHRDTPQRRYLRAWLDRALGNKTQG
jgi:hypothetical protein